MFAACFMRLYAYIDGFNLYHGALEGTDHRWLDVRTLCENLVGPEYELVRINYYISKLVATGVQDGARMRQEIYLRALQSIDGVQVHFGKFRRRRVWQQEVSTGRRVQVFRTEEKGSDVNLAAHLVLDAALNRFDAAVVVSNDSDLAEPIRLVREELGKTIGVLTPARAGRRTNRQLSEAATFTRRITQEVLAASQLPEVVVLDRKEIRRPSHWGSRARAPSVFISHAIGDQTAATELAVGLENEGIHVVPGPEAPAGESITAALGRSLRAADSILFLVSPLALKSERFRADLAHALAQQPSGRPKRLAPVLIEPVKLLPPFLQELGPVDLTDKSRWNEGLSDLANTLATDPGRQTVEAGVEDPTRDILAASKRALEIERETYVHRQTRFIWLFRAGFSFAAILLLAVLIGVAVVRLAPQAVILEVLNTIALVTVGLSVGFFFRSKRSTRDD